MYTQIEEHPTHFILHHKAGHEIHIAKGPLNKQTINKIKKFADGGQAPTQGTGPITPDTANDFMKGFNSQTTASNPKPKAMARGGEVNNPKLQQAYAHYNDGTPPGGAQPPPDDTDVDTDEPETAATPPQQNATQAQQPQRNPASDYGYQQIGNVAKSVWDKLKNGVHAVDSTELGHLLLHGGDGTVPMKPEDNGQNPNVQPAVAQQGTDQPQFQNIGVNVPRGTEQQVPFYDPTQVYQQALGQQSAGIQQAANVQGQIGQQQANAYQKQLEDLTNLQTEAQKNRDQWAGEIQNVAHDVMNSHIDPNRFMASKSTWEKISTGLGLILGGIGGGLTHQQNPALQFLNNQISNDIEAQKANLGKQDNLLGHMMRQYGNITEAENATRIHMMAMMQGQLGKIAGQNAGPLAKANATQLTGQINQQLAPMVEQASMRSAVFRGMQNQQGQGQGGVNPAVAIRMIITDPKDQEQATKELAKYQETEKLRANLKKSFNDIRSQALNGAFSPEDRNSAIQTHAGPLAKIMEGRFNLEESKNQIAAIMPAKYGLESRATENKKYGRIDDLLDTNVSYPTLEKYGIDRILKKHINPTPIATTPGFKQAGIQPVNTQR